MNVSSVTTAPFADTISRLAGQYTPPAEIEAAGNKTWGSVKTQEKPFADILSSFMGLVDETNSLQLSAEEIQLDYAAGKTDDMLAVVMAQEKAYTSLNFTVQVTNKLIEAYREIMRIQM